MAALPAAAGCGGGSTETDGTDPAGDELSGEEPGIDGAEAEEADEGEIAEAPDAGDDGVEEELPLPGPCELLGLPVREFTEAGDSDALYATAADFTVNTVEGDWNLAENWTGCDVYLFIQDAPRQNEGWPVPLWSRDVDTLLVRSPGNVHYFFVSTSADEAARQAALDGLRANVEEALAAMPAEDQAWWPDRIHYLTQPPANLRGWLRDIMLSPAWGAGIDRLQRIRYIGSYADPDRYDGGMDWFAPNLSMAANEAIYYNFEAQREASLEAEGATVIPLFSGEVISDPDWAGEMGYADVTLPDAAAMTGFDTMELDLTLACVGEGEFGTCPAWDRIDTLYLCDAADQAACTMEVGRWITTYHREGRWVHDVSGLLPLLSDGGARRFAFHSIEPYEVNLSIRLLNRGREPQPAEVTFLLRGGSFDSTYNDRYGPVTVAIPSDAVKVELATVITGHGMASPGNCAEFCNTTHHFLVNGNENIIDFPEASSPLGCMDLVGEGTVPNQYGTWWYGRSGWCPGKEVPLVLTDITEQVTAGAENLFEYQGFYGGLPYPASGATIEMSSWVVVSR